MIPGFDVERLAEAFGCGHTIVYATPGDLRAGRQRPTTIGEVARALHELLVRRPQWRAQYRAWQREWYLDLARRDDRSEINTFMWRRAAVRGAEIAAHPEFHDTDVGMSWSTDSGFSDLSRLSQGPDEASEGVAGLSGARLAAAVCLVDLRLVEGVRAAVRQPLGAVPAWVWLVLAEPRRSAEARDAVGIAAGVDELVGVLQPERLPPAERGAHDALVRLWRLSEEPARRWEQRRLDGMGPLVEPLRVWRIEVSSEVDLLGLHRGLRDTRERLPALYHGASVDLYRLAMGLGSASPGPPAGQDGPPGLTGARFEAQCDEILSWCGGPRCRAWAEASARRSMERGDEVEAAVEDLVERVEAARAIS